MLTVSEEMEIVILRHPSSARNDGRGCPLRISFFEQEFTLYQIYRSTVRDLHDLEKIEFRSQLNL